MHAVMTPMQRVLAALQHQEPDRVPLSLLLSMHGARELQLSIRDYFARAANVVEGQLRLQAKFGHDCIYTLFYACIEVEAWGAKVVYYNDGPPNCGEPMLAASAQIARLEVPRISACACLQKVITATAQLKQQVGDDLPIVGVVMSPFSLPVMQLGFAAYLDLLHAEPEAFAQLMRVNEEFCVAWANAQLAAGATAIAYFDPVSSPTIIPPELFRRTGLAVAQRTLGRIQGPTIVHFGSGRCLPIIADLAALPAVALGVSAEENLGALQRAAVGKFALLGNLNGITMRRWSEQQAEAEVKQAIARAGHNARGFILADNHGEIPWQVPEHVLLAIGNAVRKWGTYPLNWIGRND